MFGDPGLPGRRPEGKGEEAIMVSSIQNNISAVFTYGTKMGVHGYNIANVNTDGYKKYRADIVELSHGSVRADVRRVETPGISYYDPSSQSIRETSNVNLAEEFAQIIPTEIGYKANLKMISAYDEVIGGVLDILG